MGQDNRFASEHERAYALVHLDAIQYNLKQMRRLLPPSAKILGVVKADGYGHGLIPVAKAIADEVAGFGVATVEEALLLRQHKITKPVLVFGPAREIWYKEMIQQHIRPAIFQLEKAKAFNETAAALSVRAAIHLKVDTGMGRIGMRPDEAAADMVKEMAGLSALKLEGIFTHFACADEKQKDSTHEQIRKFEAFLSLLKERGITIPIRHCANSAGVIEGLGTDYELVRPGIAMYGIYPSDEVSREPVCLKPVLELRSHITYIKTIYPGESVSYGSTFTARQPMRVATIPVGYGDGYPRNLSGRGWVLIRGRKAPVLGRICMDQFMVDVSRIPAAVEGDQVTLIGRDQNQCIRIEDLAAAGGGFHYEIPCDLGKRIPRIYMDQNGFAGRKDYFQDIFKGF